MSHRAPASCAVIPSGRAVEARSKVSGIPTTRQTYEPRTLIDRGIRGASSPGSLVAAFLGMTALCGLLTITSAAAGSAQVLEPPSGGMIPADRVPPELKDVGIDQRLDTTLPLDTPLKDETGRAVRLGDYFGKRPVVFALVYYNCPMLCTQVLNGLVSALGVVSLDAGRDFDVVAVSFDPRDTPKDAATKKEAYVARYRRAGAELGWHFLTGDPAAIERVTKAAGFRYRFDEGIGQFAHASAIMVATPDGRLSHYFYGIEYGPRDLRLALVEASSGKIGNPVDQILLYCFHYDPSTGKYGAVVIRMVRVGGVLTLLAVIGGILFMSLRSRRRPRALPSHVSRLTSHARPGGPR